MMTLIIMSKKYLIVSNREHFYAPSNGMLSASLIHMEYHSCGKFYVISHPQEVESNATDTFEAYAWLVYRIKGLVSSNSMGIMTAVSVIFNTG